jgi:hypothetical protein
VSPAELTRVGEALFGERWQTDMATLLNIDSRRVRGWLLAERKIPPGIRGELVVALQQRSAACAALATRLQTGF